jgi:hypothetical protein
MAYFVKLSDLFFDRHESLHLFRRSLIQMNILVQIVVPTLYKEVYLKRFSDKLIKLLFQGFVFRICIWRL